MIKDGGTVRSARGLSLILAGLRRDDNIFFSGGRFNFDDDLLWAWSSGSVVGIG